MSQFYQIFRTLLHMLCGITIGYCLTSLTDFNTYPIDQQCVGVFAMCIIGIAVAFFWEWVQGVLFKAKLSWADLFVTTVSAGVGSVLSLAFQNNIVFWVLLLSSSAFVVYELVTYYKKLHR